MDTNESVSPFLSNNFESSATSPPFDHHGKKKKKQPTTTTNIYNAKTKITQSDDVDDPGNTNLHTGLEYIRIIPSYSEHASMLTEIKWSEL